MKILFILSIAVCSVDLIAQEPDTASVRRELTKQGSGASKVTRIFVAPVTLISLGLYTKQSGSVMNRFAVKDWRDSNYPHFRNHADDHMQFLPIWIVYGLDIVKVKPKNDFLNRSLLLIKSEVLMNVMVWSLKYGTDIVRPDGSNDRAFPSGHTAQAFVAATFMHKELGHRSVWYSIGAYSMATSVAAFRVLNNKHWFSDVLAGAGFGILATNIAYATHRYKWGKRPSLVAMPTYMNGPGIYISWRLGTSMPQPHYKAKYVADLPLIRLELPAVLEN
jgi:membrane-associated phospholipid phosphatase